MKCPSPALRSSSVVLERNRIRLGAKIASRLVLCSLGLLLSFSAPLVSAQDTTSTGAVTGQVGEAVKVMYGS